MSQGKLKVTLKRSKIGLTEKQKLVVKGLGLRKINSERVLVDTSSVRSMIRKVQHLVEVGPA